MKKTKLVYRGVFLIAAFLLWTFLIQVIDVRCIGQSKTAVGFASLNASFHAWTGVHTALYTLTDWLGLVPICFCLCFGGFGLLQWIKRKNLFQVDFDLLLLGIAYAAVIFVYAVFEAIPINYRPILINGVAEASYPSSTVLLVLSVMPTVIFQIKRRMKNTIVRKIMIVSSVLFSLFTLIARTIAGVHWLTDIIGAVLFSTGLYSLYAAGVLLFDRKSKE